MLDSPAVERSRSRRRNRDSHAREHRAVPPGNRRCGGLVRFAVESPVAAPWRFVIYSTEYVEIHVDKNFSLGSMAGSVFKGMLRSMVENTD